MSHKVSNERLAEMLGAWEAQSKHARLGHGMNFHELEMVSILTELAALRTQAQPVVKAAAGWLDISEDAKDGSRILLLWEPVHGLPEHVELGWYSGGKSCWTNTYGKPFNGEPDKWAPLAPFAPLPAQTQPVVKMLEWRKLSLPVQAEAARTAFGDYRIAPRDDGRGWYAFLEGHSHLGPFSSDYGARNAAQADFTARILSTLTQEPS